MNMAPTVAHCVSLPAPRGGRCACGLAKPDPRPWLAPDSRHHKHLQVQAAEPALPGRRRAASSGGSALHAAEGEAKSVGAP